MNDQVTVTYEGLLANGELFESSADTGPLAFQLGRQEVFPSFEQCLLGMGAGESKTFQLPPEEGHGPHKPELLVTVARGMLDSTMDLKPGVVVGIAMEKEGQQHKIPALVKTVDDKEVTVDFNHPLAGQTLTYNVTLQEIRESADDGQEAAVQH
jgi:FKBP-type peptidyl-prolyl cis-trans isomerase 2